MQAALNICYNPFNLAADRAQHAVTDSASIAELVDRYCIRLDQPVICLHNGQPMLEASWPETTLQDNDVLAFVYVPQGGGGGSNPVRLALTIALAVYAPALAGKLVGAQSGILFEVARAGIGLLGTALINALVPPTQAPKARQQSAALSPSPTYSIGAQGNQARIGQPIPVLYGSLRPFPDFAAQPYVEYENNEQYLYQLFCITQGKCSFNVDDIWLEDTPINGFTGDYTIEKIEPFAASTLYPYEVFNVSEVTGQEIIDIQIGYFVANPVDTQINQLSFDIVLPRGLYYLNDDGNYESRTVSVVCLAQPINNSGATIGPAVTLGTESISAASPTAIRRTFKYSVSPGRYQVAVSRSPAFNSDQRLANDMVWAGARGYSSQARTYGNLTMLAIKLKATNTVSNQSSRKVNIAVTRRLPAPSVVADEVVWSIENNTQSIAWAIADMIRAEYGAGVAESRYNLAQLMSLHTIWESRGDTLNALFDTASTFWEALTLACRAGRCRPYIQGGVIHFVRDSLQTLPTVLFSNRNIVKDTFRLNYVMPSEDNADAVDVEYLDESYWKPRTIRCALDAGSVTKPVKVQAFGITNRAQAFREGMYMAAANRYRRKEITFETELEGHIPSLGDLIGVQHDMPEWGQYGEAIAYTTGQIISSEPFEWVDGATHFMLLRTATGGAQGPIEVTRGADDATLVFNPALLSESVYTGWDKEKTHIVFGPSGRVIQLARVLSIKPRKDTVEIVAINEDARVHSADGTTVPVDVFDWSLPAPTLRPILADFTLTQSGSGLTPSLALSWQPPAGSTKFIIETSTDDENWSTIAEITQNTFNFVANIGLLYVRVAAFGSLKGPYVTKSINVGQVAPPPDVASGTITPTGQTFGVKWAAVPDSDAYKVQVVVAASVKREFTLTSNTFDYSLENALADGGPWRTIGVRIWALKGGVQSQNPLVLSGTNQAPAAPSVTLVPGQGSIGITVSPSTEFDYAGTLIYASDTAEFTPGPATLVYEGTGTYYLLMTTGIKYIKAAHYDTYGKTGLNYSNEYSTSPGSTVGGIESVDTLPATGTADQILYLTTDEKLYRWDATLGEWVTGASGGLPGPGEVTSEMLATGAVIANKISVANLAAINANMGAITAGSITLDNAGWISGGMSAYGVGTGFYLGYSSAAGGYVMQVGNSTKGFTWDGTDFTIKGNFLAGSVNINNRFIVDATGSVQIKSASSGARNEYYSDVIKTYDASGVLRVKLGNLLA
ncbi:host specificity factor TipJ family phage tail protein [Methylophilus sp. VKM B-3414]|uniref:host specificity factor TipJ family phage tail protein n=1 Tax=Methylophilus sp. VKM B-3414 TaxID=3076121 RepID=UPI0028CA3E8B|nr:host specificity factor TipJ family phage tail protein [Methylophilus sp. VKM B-3414]MDT7849911.1 host specificity factor TipJ family phage tail protein [Methylophilus sp. VKM B-3414]